MQNKDRESKLYIDKSLTKLNLFRRLTTFGFGGGSVRLSGYKPRESISQMNEGIIDFYLLKSDAEFYLERGNLILKILNFTVLPLILGTLGACAYVTRLSSDQIKDSTFSSTSPVRHLVRVGLGALAGVVVGFGWIGSGLSWSPLALAFVAGYAIEPVFASVDGIAEKFRKP